MLWYLCQAPFSCSAVGASPSQPLQVGLIFPLGLVSLLHITVLYRHCTFTGVLSDLHQYSEKSQPLSMAQYFLVSWIHRQAAAGKGDMLSSYLFAVRPVFPFRGGKQLHSRCQQECSRKCSLSDTVSCFFLQVLMELVSQDCCPSPSRMLAAMTQRGSESYSRHPSALGRGGESLPVLNIPYKGLK